MVTSADDSKSNQPKETQESQGGPNTAPDLKETRGGVAEASKGQSPSPAPDATEADEYMKAATHSTDQAPHTHPAHVEHAQEPTGRHADDEWKKSR